MLFGAEEHIARIWCYAFHNFVWEDSRDMQTATVDASSEQLDVELLDGARRMAASRQVLPIENSKRIQDQLALPAPSSSPPFVRRAQGMAVDAPPVAAAPPPPPSPPPAASHNDVVMSDMEQRAHAAGNVPSVFPSQALGQAAADAAQGGEGV